MTIGLLASVALLAATPSFQYCFEQRKAELREPQLYKSETIMERVIPPRVQLNAGCIGHVFRIEHDTIEAMAAIFSGCFSLVLTISTILLWQETKRLAAGTEVQSKDMRVSILEAARAATAMEQNAVSAEATVSTMKEHGERQLRAYVYTLAVQRVLRDGKQTVVMIYKNFGRTPAYDLVTVAGVFVLPYPFDPNNVPPRPEVFPDQGKETLAPSRTTEKITLVPLISSDMESLIISGRFGLWTFGDLIYKDAFGNSKYTNFRLVCRGPNWSSGVFSPVADGNDSN